MQRNKHFVSITPLPLSLPPSLLFVRVFRERNKLAICLSASLLFLPPSLPPYLGDVLHHKLKGPAGVARNEFLLEGLEDLKALPPSLPPIPPSLPLSPPPYLVDILHHELKSSTGVVFNKFLLKRLEGRGVVWGGGREGGREGGV